MLISEGTERAALTKPDGGPCDRPEVSRGQEKHPSCDTGPAEAGQCLLKMDAPSPSVYKSPIRFEQIEIRAEL